MSPYSKRNKLIILLMACCVQNLFAQSQHWPQCPFAAQISKAKFNTMMQLDEAIEQSATWVVLFDPMEIKKQTWYVHINLLSSDENSAFSDAKNALSQVSDPPIVNIVSKNFDVSCLYSHANANSILVTATTKPFDA